MTNFIEQKLKDMTMEELEKLAYHDISIENILKVSNPLGCWMELDSDITKGEIDECIKKGEEEISKTPLWSYLDKSEDKELQRKRHIQKIAFFKENEPKKPVSLDIGIPGMGAAFGDFHIIYDGNHRISGSHFSERKTIKTNIMGDEDFAKELGLWNPNIYQQELYKRYEQENINRYKDKYDKFVEILKRKLIKDDQGNYQIEIKRSEFLEWCDIDDFYLSRKNKINQEEKLVRSLKFDKKPSKSFLCDYTLSMKKEDATVFIYPTKKNKKIIKSSI